MSGKHNTCHWWLGILASFVLCAVVLPGCGPSGGLDGDTGAVSGKVTHADKPIPAGSTVVFMHGIQGVVAAGVVSADGSYSLKTRNKPEVLVGKYDVSITPPIEETESMSPEEMMKLSTEEKKPPAPKECPEIPEKYRDAATSGLKAEVKVGANTFDFDLKD